MRRWLVVFALLAGFAWPSVARAQGDYTCTTTQWPWGDTRVSCQGPTWRDPGITFTIPAPQPEYTPPRLPWPGPGPDYQSPRLPWPGPGPDYQSPRLPQ